MRSRIQLAAVLAGMLTLGGCGGSGGGSTVTENVTVTASGANVTATPTTLQPIPAGATASFIVTTGAAYTRTNVVAGTCPAGSFAGATYTTGVLTADCTVIFSATLNTYSVTPSGTNLSITPGSAQTVAHGATRAFTVTADANYTLSNAVGGTCPAGSFAGAVYTTGAVTGDCTVSFSATLNSTTLTASTASLALAASGLARTITITNTGASTAFAVNYTVALPAGTSVAPANCGSIAASGSCVLTITPGATPSAAPGDTNPVPVTLTVAGSNTNTVAPVLQVLAYGSVYQGGYLFAIDDATPATSSIGGKVAALTDQAAPYPNGIAWSDIVVVPGIDETSTSPSDACNGKSDGACNTAAIIAANSPPARDPAAALGSYAAGLCTATIGGYSDWYLPAVCEMGSDGGAGCGTAASPVLQNIRSNLAENGDLGNFSGSYWSSTQVAMDPAISAWSSYFAQGGGAILIDNPKGFPMGVRCARALTQ